MPQTDRDAERVARDTPDLYAGRRASAKSLAASAAWNRQIRRLIEGQRQGGARPGRGRPRSSLTQRGNQTP